jgi:hypothetical protein
MLCDFSIDTTKRTHYRLDKRRWRANHRRWSQTSPYPLNANITTVDISSQSTRSFDSAIISHVNQSIDLSSFWCNRGIGTLRVNGSIACFCPPQYYGNKCQFHNDRFIFLLHVNLFHSIYASTRDDRLKLRFIIVFQFNNQTLGIHTFSSFLFLEEMITSKRRIHFHYSRSPDFLEHRLARYRNRSQIIHEQPYTLRIHMYELRRYSTKLTATWQYRIHFDHLPVYQLAQVLRLREIDHVRMTTRNPCSSSPCHRNKECHQLINQPTHFVCLCGANRTGENCVVTDTVCRNNHCAHGGLCQAEYRSLLQGNHPPFCVCPYGYVGERCHIRADQCAAGRCLNKGTCYMGTHVEEYRCVCTEEYYGLHCELLRSLISLTFENTIAHKAVVIQYFNWKDNRDGYAIINQKIYSEIPSSIDYRAAQPTAPELVVGRLYLSMDARPQLHLLISIKDASSVIARLNFSMENHCAHINTFSNSKIAFLQFYDRCHDLL